MKIASIISNLVRSEKREILNVIEKFKQKTTQHNYFWNGNTTKKTVNIINKI